MSNINPIYRHLSPDEYKSIADRILYEDSYLFIFNKLPGEIVQGDKTGDEPLSEKLKAFVAQRDNKPANVFMGVTHRLDRPVSGIIVFAKRSKSLERLNEAFRLGAIHKKYHTLVSNPPVPDQGELTHMMVRNEKQNKSYVANEASKGAKEARLKYNTLKKYDNYTLLEIELLTGRHHQIRCQLAHIGSPIKGDLKYGARRSNKDGSISLHAFSIRFEHPVSKEEIYLEAHRDLL